MDLDAFMRVQDNLVDTPTSQILIDIVNMHIKKPYIPLFFQIANKDMAIFMRYSIDFLGMLNKTPLDFQNDLRSYMEKCSCKHFIYSLKSRNSFQRKALFEIIYKKGVWSSGDKKALLSGPGSSIENTREVVRELNAFIYGNNCKSILDLGCGDLNWISKTPFFNDTKIQYTGVDIVELLIRAHSKKYPNKTFYAKDLVSFNDMEFSSLIVIRDVVFHLKNEEVIQIFKNIKNKFRFIAITSCKNEVNTDVFDRSCFSYKNLEKEPFNINASPLLSIDEPMFDRSFCIYMHEDFYL